MVQTAPNPNHAGTPAPLTTEAEPSAPVRACPMGMGCEEAGICYAAAAGQPDRCSRPEREVVADLIATGVRKINRVIASGMHEGDAIYELADAIAAALGNSDAVMTPAAAFCAPDVSDEVPGMNP